MSRYRDSVTHRDEADHAQFMAAIAAVAGAIALHDGGARVTKVALTRRGGGWHNAVHRDLGSNPTVLAAAQVSHRAPAAAIRHAAHALVVHTSARVVHDAATSVARQHEADYRALLREHRENPHLLSDAEALRRAERLVRAEHDRIQRLAHKLFIRHTLTGKDLR